MKIIKPKILEFEYGSYIFKHECDEIIDGVYDGDGRFVPYTGKKYISYGKRGYAYTSACLDRGEITAYEDVPAIWLGKLRGHYGHFLIDVV